MKDETLRTAFQSLETLIGTQEEVLAYEARLKRVLDEEAAVREAELRAQEAHQEGRQEGRQEEKKITARRLLTKGIDIETIAGITELSEEQINKIQRNMEN